MKKTLIFLSLLIITLLFFAGKYAGLYTLIIGASPTIGEYRKIDLKFNDNNVLYTDDNPLIVSTMGFEWGKSGCDKQRKTALFVMGSVDGTPIYSNILFGDPNGVEIANSNVYLSKTDLWSYNIINSDFISGKHRVCTVIATDGVFYEDEWRYNLFANINNSNFYYRVFDVYNSLFTYMFSDSYNLQSLASKDYCVFNYGFDRQRSIYSGCSVEYSSKVDAYRCDVFNKWGKGEVAEFVFLNQPSIYKYYEKCTDAYVIKQSDIEKIKNNDVVQAELQLIMGQIDDLNASLQEKMVLLEALNLTSQQQASFIKSLDLKIEEQANIILQLSSVTSEQAAIINALGLQADEQALMIASLTSVVEEQAIILEGLDLKIEEQAFLINELSINLEEKAQLVSLLQVENVKQAQLIVEMKLSFSEQASIIDRLGNTVKEDAVIIENLDLNIEEQSMLINELERTNEEKIQIINDLSLSLDEQKVMIDELKGTLAVKTALIASLDLNVKEQQEIISYLSETNENKELLIGELNKSLLERAASNTFLRGVLAVVSLIILFLLVFILVKVKK